MRTNAEIRSLLAERGGTRVTSRREGKPENGVELRLVGATFAYPYETGATKRGQRAAERAILGPLGVRYHEVCGGEWVSETGEDWRLTLLFWVETRVA